MSPSSNTHEIGKNALPRRRSSVLSSPDKRGRTGEPDSLAMGAITSLLQQVMTSHEAIFSAKEAVRVNLSDRKSLALKIAQLESLPSSENAEILAGLRVDLRNKSNSIRLLQHKLAGIEKTMSLPSGLFPAKVDTCHELIHHIIEVLKEAKEESREFSSCRRELDTINEKVAAMKETHHKEKQDLKGKVDAVTKELEKLRQLTTKKKANKKRKARESYETMDTLFSSSDEEDDNSAADSDYVDDEDRKPSTKRRRGNGTPAAKAVAAKSADVMEEIDELLETSAATCCSCHGKCATKACACKSQNRDCTDECSCEPTKCRNKSGGTSKSTCPENGPIHQAAAPSTTASDASAANSSNTILVLQVQQ
ncbi:hypothetical protein ON010_g12946 [Phytophthora cinnamomi]|nr:hypothetical protein ON010_g12946 [Phytophthora cinnamomi]